MATAYFKVARTADGGATIQARHPDAKQALFGWGSDQSGDRMSLYGRMVSEGINRGDYALWEWKLRPSAVAMLCQDITGHIDDPSYYKKGPEKTASLELVRKLTSPQRQPSQRKRPSRGRKRS